MAVRYGNKGILFKVFYYTAPYLSVVFRARFFWDTLYMKQPATWWIDNQCLCLICEGEDEKQLKMVYVCKIFVIDLQNSFYCLFDVKFMKNQINTNVTWIWQNQAHLENINYCIIICHIVFNCVSTGTKGRPIWLWYTRQLQEWNFRGTRKETSGVPNWQGVGWGRGDEGDILQLCSRVPKLMTHWTPKMGNLLYVPLPSLV